MLDLSQGLEAVYQHYKISPEYGFLPEQPPLEKLPAAFEDWEEIAQQLADLVARQEVVASVASRNAFPWRQLEGAAQLERAMQLLAFIGHAWIVESGSVIIPSQLAQPWSAMAERLGRPPVIAHPSYVLHNWRRSVPRSGLQYENLEVLQPILGGKDEAAFILVTVMMEYHGASAIRGLIGALEGSIRGDINEVEHGLREILEALGRMTSSFDLMREDCRPSFFYDRIRPYLASFQGMVMQGVGKESPQDYHGGSAAQSSIMQSLDAGLSLEAPPAHHRAFLHKMREYMPREHAAFVKELEKDERLVVFCRQHSPLQSARQACIEALVAFRNEHLKIMAEYIIAPAKGQEALGTGGTHPSRFLKSVRDATKHSP
ncbi:MAG: hypothetical protein AAFQ68_03380 [Bacteroidota bacterium]